MLRNLIKPPNQAVRCERVEIQNYSHIESHGLKSSRVRSFHKVRTFTQEKEEKEEKKGVLLPLSLHPPSLMPSVLSDDEQRVLQAYL